MSIYSVNILSAGLSVMLQKAICKTIEHDFLGGLKIEVWFFFEKSCPFDAHLFYEYLARQSVGQATKGKNVEIKKHDFLVGYLR